MVRCRSCETLVSGLGPLIRANASTARTSADQQSFAAAATRLCHTNRFDCNTTNGCEQACLDMAHMPMDKVVQRLRATFCHIDYAHALYDGRWLHHHDGDDGNDIVDWCCTQVRGPVDRMSIYGCM